MGHGLGAEPWRGSSITPRVKELEARYRAARDATEARHFQTIRPRRDRPRLLAARSPEPQPAERLWPLIDEPAVNRPFVSPAEPDATIAERCRRLDAATVRPHTDFRRWPRRKKPN